MRVFGIDYSTNPSRVAIAFGMYEFGRLTIGEAFTCRGQSPVEILARRIKTLDGPVLLAIDAPLGWPVPLVESLQGHSAGNPLSMNADLMFLRETDRAVHRGTGHVPLSVGADRIARTAHHALAMLATLRSRTGLAIPVAWSVADIGLAAVIEVYPAATLRTQGIVVRRDAAILVERYLDQVSCQVTILPEVRALLGNRDVLDATVCALAASDFLARQAQAPRADQAELARREGWIWVRNGSKGLKGDGVN